MMSDNKGYNVVTSKMRQQMMVRDPIINPLDKLTILMVTQGLSASEAIRKYTSILGLPPKKAVETLKANA